jgi:hypothetical protein
MVRVVIASNLDQPEQIRPDNPDPVAGGDVEAEIDSLRLGW